MQPPSALDILVVDDDEPLREMLTRSFEREGHRVTAVADGEAAIAQATERDFDVVLLDVALGPGPAGHDVARALRQRRAVVPIIMLTALDSEADVVQGLEAGADDYVTKPFGLAELRSRIRAVLRRAHGRVVDGVRSRRPGDDRPARAPGHRRRLAGARDLQRVRAAGLPDGAARQALHAARSSCARSGATAPTATRAPSTSTSGTCARSSRSARRSRSLILTVRGAGYRFREQ